jgi:thioredoxin 2
MLRNYFIIRCLRCGQKNRISRDSVKLRPICGRCSAYLDELIVQCIECGTKNRISEERLTERAICSKCGVPLYQGSVSRISDESFNGDIASFPGPALVCFWSFENKSFRSALKLMEEIASKYAGAAKIAQMNRENSPRTFAEYAIEKTPTFLFFKDGHPVEKIEKRVTIEEIDNCLRSVIKGKEP